MDCHATHKLLFADDATIPIDIDYSGVDEEQMEAARVVFETVGEVLGRSARGVLSVRVGFYELGGNSLNSIYTITKLREKGYYIRKFKVKVQQSVFLRVPNFFIIIEYHSRIK